MTDTPLSASEQSKAFLAIERRMRSSSSSAATAVHTPAAAAAATVPADDDDENDYYIPDSDSGDGDYEPRHRPVQSSSSAAAAADADPTSGTHAASILRRLGVAPGTDAHNSAVVALRTALSEGASKHVAASASSSSDAASGAPDMSTTHPVNINKSILAEPVASDDFICCVCHDIPRDPVNTVCGHTACLPCYREIRRHATSDDIKCPMCRVVTHVSFAIPVNGYLQKQIEKLQVDCPLQCGTKYSLGPNFGRHVAHLANCPNGIVNCECGRKYKRGENFAHKAVCIKRKTECSWCKRSFNTKEIIEHMNSRTDEQREEGTCSGSGLCPNRCLIPGNESCDAAAAAAAEPTDLQVTVVPNHLLSHHLANECSRRLVQCPIVGCHVDVRASQLRDHKRKACHMEALSNEIKRIRSIPVHPFDRRFVRLYSDVVKVERGLSRFRPCVMRLEDAEVEKIKVEYRSSPREGGDLWAILYFHDIDGVDFQGGTFGLQLRVCKRATALSLDQLSGADLTPGTEFHIFHARFNVDRGCRTHPVRVFPSTDFTSLFGNDCVDPENRFMVAIELYRLPSPNEIGAAEGAAAAARVIEEID